LGGITHRAIRQPNNSGLFIGLFCVWQTAPLVGQSLLTNRDFGAGITGFMSDYTYAPGDISPSGG
jgi:hypothetical protein